MGTVTTEASKEMFDKIYFVYCCGSSVLHFDVNFNELMHSHANVACNNNLLGKFIF